jgi:exodeoxyribonuclease VII large subunit
MADDIPSLADLRRTRSKRPASRAKPPATSPSLFDDAPEPEPEPTRPPPAQDPSRSAQESAQEVTTADVLAEQSRSLNAPFMQQPRGPRPPSAQDRLPSAQDPSAPDQESHIFTVGELVRRVRTLVESTYGHVTVEGEISNWRPAASGHCYFTLKDGDAQLSIVLFRRQAALLRFRPKDGDAVRISGQLSVYESRGQMQLIAETMQQTGLGALLAAVQALKDRLRREGLFDNARPLPPFPRCIGVVTSLHGAALRDIVKVCRRRHASVNLLIYPAAVQGPNCAAEVAAGVRWFSSHPDRADVVLVARGGGSWEDLHGFNDEALVRTIAACTVPVITGIGHAPDSTLADAAADLCAPTPSAAAELVTAAQHGIADRVARLRSRLERSNRYNLLRFRQRISSLSANSIIRRARSTAQRLDELTFRSESAITRNLRTRATRLIQLESRLRRQHVAIHLANDRHRLDSLQQRLHSARTRPLLDAHTRLSRAVSQLKALSPLRVLERGYALVYGPNGNLLRSATEAPEGTSITAHLSKGRLRAKVTSTE